MIMKYNYNIYYEKLRLIKNIINNDLCYASPEIKDVESSIFKDALKSASEQGNLITRYFEDDEYARAYCVEPYHDGIMIIFDKSIKTYNIIVIEEDDGAWFPTQYYDGIIANKSSFVCLLSEAIFIFNSNFNSEKYDL